MSGEIKLSERDREALEQVRRCIHGKPDEMPSVKELSRSAMMNEDKFKKGFKFLFGDPPYNFHLQLKMEEAQRLLRQTDLAVCEIAWTLGYEHSSNFCIAFKKKFNLRPLEYRSRLRPEHGKEASSLLPE